MGLTVVDYISLILTALVLIYLLYRFFQYKPKGFVWYVISFVVLLVSGVLILVSGLEILHKPWVKVVASIVPFTLAIGLVVGYYDNLKWWWIVILGIGFIIILLNEAGVNLGKVWYPLFHAFAGLTIFILPIVAVTQKKAPAGFIWVTVGGGLIGIGGLALAMLSFDKPILSAETINAILTPLILLMTLAYTLGFIKIMKPAETKEEKQE